MTLEIGLVFGILGMAILLFVTEWVRVDLVALIVMVSLAVSGVLSPRDALTGFSNPAVVTVWAVFILSGGLARTGIAGWVGRQVLALAGTGEVRLIAVIMITASTLSAFMNNVGVAALLLPVVVDIGRRTGIPSSRLLIPLAFSSLLGGLMTQIGTPPNILISEVLHQSGLGEFQLFDFAWVGMAVNVAGIAFMVVVGRHLLPRRPSRSRSGDTVDLVKAYGIRERLSVIRVPEGSTLAGATLRASHLGSAIGIQVLAIYRGGRTLLAPSPEMVLWAGDRLLVEGQQQRVASLEQTVPLERELRTWKTAELVSSLVEVAEVGMTPGSELLGKTLRECEFRQRFGVLVIGLRREGRHLRTNLADTPLTLGDILLLQGSREQIDALRSDPDFVGTGAELAAVYNLEERLMTARVREGSSLAGKTLLESRLGDAYGLGVLAILRGDEKRLAPIADEVLEGGDVLMIKGREEDLAAIEGLHSLRIDPTGEAPASELESERIGLAEVVVSPRATCVGKSLIKLQFRSRYGLNVLAIGREGRLLRTDVGRHALRYGDTLLLQGPREKLLLLGHDNQFLVLHGEAKPPVRTNRAPLAGALMAGVVLSVIVGWLPIYIAAVAGAVLMVLTRCLTMDEAYSYIEWRAVFLIAGMLPLGLAMDRTGAAGLVTEWVVTTVGGFGPLAVTGGLFVVTALCAQVMPTSAVAILMAPIAISTAQGLGVSPLSLLMAVSLSASASFMSPVAHPANVLIMGPGGYRFGDYFKVGLPLTIVCLLVVLLLLPVFWPF